MRKFLFMALAVAAAAASMPTSASATCTTIRGGRLLYPQGSYLAGTQYKLGDDPFGYNYEAHRFKGSYFNIYANRDGFPPYQGDDATYLASNPRAASHRAWASRNVMVDMQWNDAWLSNRDCDGDGALDRHFGFPSYVGAGAWLQNKYSWFVTADGRSKRVRERLVVSSIPADGRVGSPTSYFGEQTVYAADGAVLGPQLWVEFYVASYFLDDPSTGQHVEIDSRGDHDADGRHGG